MIMSNKDCHTLEASSKYIRNWLAGQPSVKEESLTDWLLYDVAKNSPNFLYRAFKRHEEARKTGADWEWWLLFPTHNIRLRIQAKKLIPKHNHKPDIARTNKYGLQIDKLLKDSTATNSIPLYALYSGNSTSSQCPNGIRGEGVFIAGGNSIYANFITPGTKFISDSDLLALSNPLSCILCCPYSSSHIDYFSRYYPDDSAVLPDRPNDPIRGIHQILPNYVDSFLENCRDGIPDWWEDEFKQDISDLEAMLVIELRGKNND